MGISEYLHQIRHHNSYKPKILFKCAFTKILNLLDAWEGKGSGWVIEQVQDIHININNYDPLAGSSYIPLPRQLQNLMHGLINIKNTGEKKVPGKMKDVKPLQNIDDVTALKSKSYIVITAGNEEQCKHKGHDYNFTGDEYNMQHLTKKYYTNQ